jgi:predicted component of type VI protein secretion system
MATEKVISVTIAIPQSSRDLLRRLVLETNMKNPDHTVTVSQIGREIVVEHLKKILEERKGATNNDNPFNNQ